MDDEQLNASAKVFSEMYTHREVWVRCLIREAAESAFKAGFVRGKNAEKVLENCNIIADKLRDDCFDSSIKGKKQAPKCLSCGTELFPFRRCPCRPPR